MRILIFISALFFAQFIWAAENQPQEQEQGDTTEEAEQAGEEPVLDTTLTPEELVAAENDELTLSDPDNLEESEEDEEQSSSRFIPTEQISQDLGVSFPVDI